MTKTKTKSRKLAKGVALGFATMLTTASMPVGAVLALAEEWKGSDIVSNTNRISIGEENKTTKTYVTKGEPVTIPQGVYYSKGSDTPHIIGSAVSGTITKSKVYVTYANGTDLTPASGNTFVASQVGTYKITYAVVDGGVLYTYDISVICEASEAEFEFASNDKNIIPSVYDVAIAENKDIVLPLPTVNGEDGKPILKNESGNFTTGSSFPTGRSTPFVQISITNGSEDLKIVEEDGKFVVKTVDGGHITNALKGKEYTINYSFYEVKDMAKVFIASTTKTFTVKDGYYKASKVDNAENGYELVATLSSKPDSAVVGVEKTLPTISATTKAENSPASESVEIWHELKVYTKNDNGEFKKDVTADVIKDDKFVANAEGDYLFEYIAHDFYGHDNQKSKATTTFKITNVKDTKAPDVFMYDAGSRTAEEVANKTFRSAENILKSKTVNRNIVMYAIGGKDNLETNELTLRREIWDANVKRFSIEEQAYNGYNLIFAPTAGTGTNVFTQIVSDNYEIERQMILGGDVPTSESEIKDWLKAHKYLLVTTQFNKGVDGNDIVEGLEETEENATQQLIDAGYAYIKPATGSDESFKFSQQATYTFYYYANDNHGNTEKRADFTIALESGFSDNSAPTITFPSTLQDSYLPTDTITFKAITSSNVADNSVDGRPVVGTAYRFLKTAGASPVGTNETGSEKLSYIIKGNTNEEYNDKYFFTGKDSNGKFEQDGWHVAKDDETSIKIDLKKKPEDAKYVEILAYAIDDYGNIGFYNKVITFSDEDNEIPVLDKVSNVPTGVTYQAPATITLPTLQFSDDKVERMTARVMVYKVTGSGEDATRQAYSSSGMKTDFNANREVFTVDAGTFKASTGGDYQVVVTVTDSANHSYSTYFNYHVEDAVIVEEPEILNISTETKEQEIGKALYLSTPTLSVSKSTAYGYIGLGDSNNATDYSIQAIEASSSNYELDKYYFTGNTSGTYKLQYNVRLLRYSKDANDFAETLTDNKLSLEEGNLVFTTESQKYYVYIEEGKLKANTELNGTGEELGDYTRLNQIAKAYNLQSKVITVSVKDVVIDVAIPDEAYKKTDYPDIETDTKVEIVKPSVSVRGAYEVDKKNSTVTINFSSNSSTSNQIAKFSLEDWEKAFTGTTANNNFEVDGEKINLLLKMDGQYKITYSIQAQDEYGASVGDPKVISYTLKSGDNEKPMFEVNRTAIKTDYSIGDSMTLEFTGASAEDIKDMFKTMKDKTSVADLLGSLQVTIKGPNGTETLENVAEGDKTQNFKYNFAFETAGDYTLTFKVTDNAGNYETDTISFTVKAKEAKTTDVKQVMGGVLIGVSVALLAGVVIYFVVSKVKLDKKERAYKRK